MRKILITSALATLLAVSATAIASNAPPAPGPAPGARAPAVPGAPAPTNNTAYEKAITAYLNNVVDKARKKKPPTSAAPQAQRPSYPMSPGYPGLGSMGQGHSRDVLPRVERITIGLHARAVIETPDGGRLRVSAGVRTPYGVVTAIRASGVWFRVRDTHRPVLLADIAGDGDTTAKVSQGLNSTQSPQTNVPMPPNFHSAPQQ